MGGGEQFFRIGAGLAALVLKPCLEGIAMVLQRAALRIDGSGAVLEGAFPAGCCMTFHGELLGFVLGISE